MSWPLLAFVLLFAEQGEAPSAPNPRECIQRFAARGDAFAARDWKSLEQHSRSYVAACQGLFGPEDIARAYVDLAVATYELDKPEDSLEAAEQCARAFSAEPYCHVYKARALLSLGRIDEGHQTIQAAEEGDQGGFRGDPGAAWKSRQVKAPGAGIPQVQPGRRIPVPAAPAPPVSQEPEIDKLKSRRHDQASTSLTLERTTSTWIPARASMSTRVSMLKSSTLPRTRLLIRG